jgi:hypothetical protein
MKSISKFKTILFLATGLLLLTGAGCERKSNPVEEYDLGNDVPANQVKATSQSFDGVVFDMQVEGRKDGSRDLDFYEGKSGSYKIKARCLIPGTEWSLKKHNFPPGADLVQTGEAGVWLVRWTPAKDIIPKDMSEHSFDVQVEFVIGQNTTARAREFFASDKRNRVRDFTLKVSYPESQPTISIVGLDKSEIKRGEVVPFTVEVVDPASSAKRRPDLVVTKDASSQTNEAKAFPLPSAVIYNPDKADQFAGNGKWVFHLYFDTTMVPAQYFEKKARFEAVEFVIYAINTSSNKTSVRKMKRLKIVDGQTPPVAQAAPKGKE